MYAKRLHAISVRWPRARSSLREAPAKAQRCPAFVSLRRAVSRLGRRRGEAGRAHSRTLLATWKPAVKLSLQALGKRRIDRLVIESVDLSLYIAHAEIAGRRHLIIGPDGKTLKTRNLLDMKRALARLHARERVLIQHSAYDEMLGQTVASADNRLGIRLGPGFETLNDEA